MESMQRACRAGLAVVAAVVIGGSGVAVSAAVRAPSASHGWWPLRRPAVI